MGRRSTIITRLVSVVLVVINIVLLGSAIVFFTAINTGISPADISRQINNWVKVRLRYANRQPLCPNCNVIVVSLDTLSANHLPCYGYSRITAPNLCRFTSNSVLFKHAYANSYYTLPNHVSLFTGLYLNRHNVYHADVQSLDAQTPLLPEVLHQNGYYTHFGMITDDAHLPIDKVYNRGIDNMIDPAENKSLWEKDLKLFEDKVKKHQKTFMFLHTYYVHSPYWINDEPLLYTDKKIPSIPISYSEFDTCSSDFITYAKRAIKDDLDHQQWWISNTEAYKKLLQHLQDPLLADKACRDEHNKRLIDSIRQNFFFSKKNINTTEKAKYIQALYDQKINDLDRQLTGLFELMSKPDIKNNTILIITSDHGEEFMEHNEIQHITLYDSNVRVPLFVLVPGVGGKTVDSVVESVDIVPTILQLVGIRNNYLLDGVSLVPDFFGGSNGKKYAVAEHKDMSIMTIRNNSYKLFLKNNNGNPVPYELYDINKDQGELRNVIFSHPEVVKLLQNELMRIISRK